MSNLTLMPFAQVPGEILMDIRLKPTHIRVLIALYMHKNKKREEVWPKRKTLALLTGIHESTISRLTTELEQWGWVTKMGNSGGCGRPAAYRVHVPDGITSKFDTAVNDEGDIVLPQTIAKSATVADSTTVADLEQNPSGIDYLTLAKSARGKEQTKNRQEHTNSSNSAHGAALPASQPAKPASRATILPDDFQPNETAQQMAAELGLSLQDELAAFCDHHAAKGTTFKDWQAGFRTWLRTSAKYRQQARPGGRGGAIQQIDPHTPVETYAQRAARQRMEEVAPMAARKAPGQRCGFAAAQAFMNGGDVIDVTPVHQQRIGG